jgi:UDP-glucose 4-epimerase
MALPYQNCMAQGGIVKKRVAFVTGGTGFIGRAVVNELIYQGWNVTALVRSSENLLAGCKPALGDITDYEPVAECVASSDMVFHLAGLVGNVPCMADPRAAISINVSGTLNVLNAARFYKTPGVYVGVGNIGDRAMYAITKATAERFVLMFNKEHRTDIVPLRVFNTYGPGQSQSSGKLITNSILRGLRGENLTIFGDGEQELDFCFVDDVAKMIVAAATLTGGGSDGRPYHVGSGVGIKVSKAASIISSLTGSKSQIVYQEKRTGDLMRTIVSDQDRLVPLRNRQLTSFEEGIIRTVESMKAAVAS